MQKRVHRPGYHKEWVLLKSAFSEQTEVNISNDYSSLMASADTNILSVVEFGPVVASIDNSNEGASEVVSNEPLWNSNGKGKRKALEYVLIPEKDNLKKLKKRDSSTSLKNKFDVKKSNDNIVRCILLGFVIGVLGFFALWLGVAVGAAAELGAGIIIIMLLACIVGGIWGAVASCD